MLSEKMKKTIFIVVLFIFNLIGGNFLLFVTEGKKDTIFNTSLLHISFSLSSILLLVFLIDQFRKRTSYFLLFPINFCVAFLIPVIGAFVFASTISIINGDFDLNLIGAGFVFSIAAGIVSIPFWSAMGVVNFVILIWYKRQFGLETGR